MHRARQAEALGHGQQPEDAQRVLLARLATAPRLPPPVHSAPRTPRRQSTRAGSPRWPRAARWRARAMGCAPYGRAGTSSASACATSIAPAYAALTVTRGQTPERAAPGTVALSSREMRDAMEPTTTEKQSAPQSSMKIAVARASSRRRRRSRRARTEDDLLVAPRHNICAASLHTSRARPLRGATAWCPTAISHGADRGGDPAEHNTCAMPGRRADRGTHQ
jgi:hypothetical protein